MSLKVSLIFCIIGVLWSSASAKNITSYGYWALDAESRLNDGWDIHETNEKIENRRINELPYNMFNKDTVITVGGTFELWMGGKPLDKKFNELRLHHWSERNNTQMYNVNLHEASEGNFSLQVVHIFIELTIHRNGDCELKHTAAAQASKSFYYSTVKSHILSITVVN